MPTLAEEITIRIKLGFLLGILATVISVTVVFVSLRTDVLRALAIIDSHAKILDTNQLQILDIRLHIQNIDDNVKFLRESHEESNRRALKNDR